MNRTFAVAWVLLAACGAGSATGRGANPIVTGDACALHQDATSCRADAQGCAWFANTRPCQVDGPACPPGFCTRPQALDAGFAADGGVAASAACACPGSAADACIVQIGGPAATAPPPIGCAAIPAGCALADRCACLSGGVNGTCGSSEQVTNLCVCDNGIR